MAKVITFSRKFPKGHIWEGAETSFVEKYLNSLQIDYRSFQYFLQLKELNIGNEKLTMDMLCRFYESLDPYVYENKIHTIRSGFRFSERENFSPRVWSSVAYKETQIIFAPNQAVLETHRIDINGPELCVNESMYWGESAKEKIYLNDGLNRESFNSWFGIPRDRKGKEASFTGQIIAWEETKY